MTKLNEQISLNFLRLQETECFNILAVSRTYCWKNHFGITVAAVRRDPYEASQMIYIFHIYKTNFFLHWKALRKSLSSFEFSPAYERLVKLPKCGSFFWIPSRTILDTQYQWLTWRRSHMAHSSETFVTAPSTLSAGCISGPTFNFFISEPSWSRFWQLCQKV